MKVELEMLPESYQDVASITGVETFLELCKLFGGMEVYIPQYKTLIKPLRNQKIVEEFNGNNVKQLAKKYHVCESTVRHVLAI
jgi:Mor family transcriptional regulator